MKRWLLASWFGLPLLVKIAAVLSVALMLAVVSVAFAQWLSDSARMFEIRRQINEQVCENPVTIEGNCPP